MTRGLNGQMKSNKVIPSVGFVSPGCPRGRSIPNASSHNCARKVTASSGATTRPMWW